MMESDFEDDMNAFLLWKILYDAVSGFMNMKRENRLDSDDWDISKRK